jgi:regulator of protease activity HflC (stomatin/prohibitin superfamily)
MTLPPPLDAPVFKVNKWDTAHEPAGITQLRNGESFLQGVERVSAKVGGPNVVAPVCHSLLPGMKVATDQVGVILKNGDVRLRATGAYPHTAFNPWVQKGAVIPIARVPGVEFDPLMEASRANRRLAKKQLGQSYRQVVLQPQQVGVFEDHGSIILASQGIYVYSPNTVLRGVIDLSRMIPIMVERETEDTVAANRNIDIKINQHGRPVPDQQGHGTLVNTTKRFIPSGYKAEVAGIRVARPEKGFVALHKDASNNISMTQGICVATGSEDFVRRAKFDDNVNNRRATLDDLEIEFGDLNNYAKSTPVLELKSKDNIDALCRVQIRWRQFRPDIWVTNRGAFTDPFDMLEEKCANMMRDWLLSVPYLDALAEKSQGFTTIEHEWTAQLNDAGFTFGVAVMGIEITTLRFPSIDKQNEQVAVQLAATNLAIESSRQNASKEHELSKLNQATHLRLQEDRDREAEAEERQQQVERRKDLARAETVTKKAEMDTKVVQAAKMLALAEEMKAKEVALAKATADAEAERIRAQGKRDAAQLAAEGAIAATKEKNDAQLDFLKHQAELLLNNPGLVQLLQLQNDLLKTQAMAEAAATNPNVVLLTGDEGLEARRMNRGFAPQVPGAAAILTNGSKNGTYVN